MNATQYFYLGAGIAVVAFLVVILNVPKEAPTDNTVTYNYFTFYNIGGIWNAQLKHNGQLFEGSFRFNPKQVEDVYMTGTLETFDTPIYITHDPDSQKEDFTYLALASTELGLHLIRALNATVIAGCTKNITDYKGDDYCADRPIIDCSSNVSVIYLKPTPPTQVTLNGSCITMSGYQLDLLKSVDRVLYGWYDIID